jgi:hypothetical protein
MEPWQSMIGNQNLDQMICCSQMSPQGMIYFVSLIQSPRPTLVSSSNLTKTLNVSIALRRGSFDVHVKFRSVDIMLNVYRLLFWDLD